MLYRNIIHRLTVAAVILFESNTVVKVFCGESSSSQADETCALGDGTCTLTADSNELDSENFGIEGAKSKDSGGSDGASNSSGNSTEVGFYNRMTRPYTMKPLSPHFGMVIENFTLTREHCRDKIFMEGLKADIHKHYVLLFKKQELPDILQIDLSRALGKIQSTFSKHQASPHPDIFRVEENKRQKHF